MYSLRHVRFSVKRVVVRHCYETDVEALVRDVVVFVSHRREIGVASLALRNAEARSRFRKSHSRKPRARSKYESIFFSRLAVSGV